ncbi:MAG: tryptophan--tRNA ligase [Microgenomates group bacterium]
MKKYSKEYQEKIAIKQRLAKYYLSQSIKNGLSGMEKVLAYTPLEYQPLAMRRGLVVAQMGYGDILALVAQHKAFTVVSGLNPSSQLHLGHKVLFDMLLELQKMGGELFIPLTDDESYVDGKVEKLVDGTRNAREKIIPVLQKMGFDPTNTHYLIDTEQTELYQFAIELSRYVSMAELTHLFGLESLANPGQVFYRGCVQLAEILMPQLPQNGGPRHTLIPVGIDQHPYILLARDVTKKIGMVPPSELVLRFFPSLADPEKKMSKSSPESALFLDDNPESIKRKIKRAFTGAVGSLEDHKMFGGVPEACSVFALQQAFNPNDIEVQLLYDRYIKGELLMGELKERTSELMIGELSRFRREGI